MTKKIILEKEKEILFEKIIEQFRNDYCWWFFFYFEIKCNSFRKVFLRISHLFESTFSFEKKKCKIGKYVDWIFIEKLTHCYYNRRKNHFPGCCCYHCKRYYKLIKEKEKWSFDGLNGYHNRWFFIFSKQSNLTLFPVFI